MTTSHLPFLDRDPHSKPQMETKVKKVFVTELDDNRDRKKEEYHIPAATETSKLLEGGVKMLKKTLIARKQAELHYVDVQLALKRQYFKSCMEALAHKRSELETKQQQAKETEMKFEKFVAENEAKRQRAMKECKAMREQNALKKREIEDLTEQMTKLETRRKVLKQKTEKYRIYKDYLLKTLDRLPSIHRHISNESLVMPVIRRHETLSITHQELLQRHKDMQLEVEQGQQQLENMKQQHSIKQLMSNRKLYELQSELEGLEKKNKQAEVSLLMRRRVTRKEGVETGRTLIAVKNLAHHCYLPEYGDLESMSVPTMMDMVKEFILDSADTERRVRKLESCSTASLTDKRWRESLKSIGSKVQIKSSSRDPKLLDCQQMEVCSLVSCREDISSLLAEETPSPKYKDLGRQFSAVRVRGDGNCFYRAVCFAHLESVLHSPRALQRFKDQIIQSRGVLVSAGFDETSFSQYMNRVFHVVDQCMAAEHEDVLLRLFNEQLISDSVVQFLRLLTSAHLQTHAEFFCNFVEAPDLKVYCRQEVEVMAMECDHVDILAVSQALDIGIHIVSMEGDERQLVHHIIPDGADPSVHLLYQMSHYNILYRQTQSGQAQEITAPLN